jgi:hypothetical protein
MRRTELACKEKALLNASIVLKHCRPRLAGLDDDSCCTHGNTSAFTPWRGMHAGSKREKEKLGEHTAVGRRAAPHV